MKMDVSSIKFADWQEVISYIASIDDTRTQPYTSSVAKKLNKTYSHIVFIVHQLKLLDLIKVEIKGRRKIISLTDNGKLVGDCLLRVRGEIRKCKMQFKKEIK